MALHEDAEADLRRLQPKLSKRIRDRLKLLGAEPRGGPNCTQIDVGYRVRIGAYRARYLVLDEERGVIVTRVVIRNEATYK